jgi:hypothetical protein
MKNYIFNLEDLINLCNDYVVDYQDNKIINNEIYIKEWIKEKELKKIDYEIDSLGEYQKKINL